MDQTVGIVGLGIMGGAFARFLVQAGWHVVGHDIDPVCRETATRAGVDVVESATAVAAKARVIMTVLTTAKALHAVVAEIVASGAPPLTLVDMGTLSLADKQRAEQTLAAAGHGMLDCPVSGTGAQAQRKDIIIYASGGASEQIRRLRPLFESFSRGVYDLGEFGNGSKMKYVANLLVAIHNVAAAEAMVLGMKAGLDPEVIFK
jgi:putative dehydrogenase